MITGIGTDIVEIARIEKAYKRQGQKFAQRILTLKEIELAPEPKKSFFPNAVKRSRIYLLNNRRVEVKDRKFISYLAKRWAAKEAVAKALGTGIGEKLTFQDIEITKEKSGKPVVKIKGRANLKIQLSISDEKSYATATAIIEE